MNWLDIVLVALIAFSIISSIRRGFSRELIGLISVIAALFCGLWFLRVVRRSGIRVTFSKAPAPGM